jgi:hypothetical protein
MAQIRFLEVDRLRGTFAVAAAARFDDDDALAAEQALRAGLRIAESFPDAQNVVESGAQAGRDAEIVHRRADHNRVGRAQFRD